jgi:acyl dehydratase
MPDTTRTGLVLARLGARYTGDPWTVTAEQLSAYALATNDPNPRYLDEGQPGGVVMPPIFPVRIIRDLFFTTLLDAENGVDMMRLVHGSQDMRYRRFLKPGDVAEPSAEIVGMEEKGSGDLYTVRYDVAVNGELALQCTSSFFIKVPKSMLPPDAKPAAKPVEAPVEPPPPDLHDVTEVTADQTFRYAAASGDENPIHIDHDYAVMAGLGGIILQGLCTMAFASRAVVQRALGGEPTGLKRLFVRFSSPVRPGDTVTTRGWRTPEGVRFESINQAGKRVLDQGIAEL